jgi:UDP-N-acetyl-2-amino-2-deoxyglucuronate dehydrogenase
VTASQASGPSHGFGIVGAGTIAAAHAHSIAAIAAGGAPVQANARLVAVTDVVPAAAGTFAQRFGCAAEPSLASLLARDDIDVVTVCVPSGLHAEVGIQAAEAGKHLIVEKPIDVSLAAADRLIAAARQAGVALTVISQHRFDPGVVELRRLLDAGALGDLVLGEASTKWHRTQAYYDSAAWRGTWALDGGALMNQGIHYADLLLWCMGPVTEVTAVCATRTHQVEVEDVALALLRFASGVTGTLVASTAIVPGSAQRLEINGTGGTIVIEDGMITRRALSDDPAAPPDSEPGTPVRPGPAAPPGPGHAASPGPDPGAPAGPEPGAAADPAALGVAAHAAQIADLLAAIDEGRRPLVTGESARATLELIRAVYESARDGRTVTLRAPGSHDDHGAIP